MADIDKILRDLIARVNALERDNTVLRKENHEMRAMGCCVGSECSQSVSASSSGARDRTAPGGTLLTRRGMLGRGIKLAAAALGAGVVLTRQAAPALADVEHTSTHFRETNGWTAISAETLTPDASALTAFSLSGDEPAIRADHGGNAPAVEGTSSDGTGVLGIGRNSTGIVGRGLVGVMGNSGATGYGAVYGLNTAVDGYGVIADATGARSAGVLGRNNDGDAIRGEGKVGVHGVSLDGNGVVGEGVGGYGGLFKSSRAQIRLAPNARIGKPTTGAHYVGELYLDKAGTLFICTVAGTPGTWRKVSTTTA